MNWLEIWWTRSFLKVNFSLFILTIYVEENY